MKFRIFSTGKMLQVSPSVVIIVVLSLFFFVLCAWFLSIRLSEQQEMTGDRNMINKEQALAVAKEDAMQVYRDLSIYTINAELKNGKWYVDYDLEGEAMAGGGPHYIISATTGEILERRYEQ